MLQGKKVIVVGLGLTGLSCVRWLINAGAKVSVSDSRAAPPNLQTLQDEYSDIAVHLGPLQAEVLQEYDMIVRSPGVSQYEPALINATQKNIPIVGDIELFALYLKDKPSRVIAITGSNGKSTVTSMVGEMAKAAGLRVVVAGNIGVPVLDALLKMERENLPLPDLFVLELSSFQLETTYSLKVTAATVLNVSEDHLDRYHDIHDYAKAKARIFAKAEVMVLNRQDSFCREMVQKGQEIRWFQDVAPDDEMTYGLREDHEGNTFLCHGKSILLNVTDLGVVGKHNASNALAALALCEAIGLPQKPLLEALKQFKGLAHRVEYVATVNDVDYYDDSKGTTVAATIAALTGMKTPVVLIAGGQGKGQDFHPLKDICAKHCRLVILLGQDASIIEKALAKAVPILYTKSLEEAVVLAALHAKPEDVVLLSPACASLDMFVDYKARGAIFAQTVKRLGGLP